MTVKTNRPDIVCIVTEGPLIVTETDGGFLPDKIEVAGADMTALIAQLFGVKVSERGFGFDIEDADFGRVRLTIERVSGVTTA